MELRGDMETRILVVGAGFAGICVGHDLLEAGIDDFEIVEMSDGVGGTWRHNTYPGAACDVPSHVYCYSFRGNPEWSRAYSPQTEILAYLERCATEFGLDDHLHFGRQVTGHTFDDDTRCWRTELADGSTITSEVVVKATGVLHQPNWPDVAGLDSFEGHLMHTARWDHEVDIAGKRVAVIGSAASAIQVVPELAATAERVTVFQRTPSYVLPRNDREFTAEEIAAFRASPDDFDRFRTTMADEREASLYPLFESGSPLNAGATQLALEYMRSVIDDPDLQAKLTPDYELGCKRILISDNWFQALALDHVELVDGPVTELTPTGVVATEQGREVSVDADIVVCATGFDPEGGWRTPPVTGPGGLALSEVWADDLISYKGVAVPGFPNFFLIDGPNSASGYLPSVATIEVDSRFVTELLARNGPGVLVEARREPTLAHCEALQARFEPTVWSGSCASWYQAPDGRIWTLFPGNLAEYTRDKDLRHLDDFEVVVPAPA
ncbi:MAG: flavin-containing monooxygenase [Acidimicrobiales bacterium]